MNYDVCGKNGPAITVLGPRCARLPENPAAGSPRPVALALTTSGDPGRAAGRGCGSAGVGVHGGLRRRVHVLKLGDWFPNAREPRLA